VEGGFEICWSCGLARDEVEVPFPESAEQITSHDWSTANVGVYGSESDNPYASPRHFGVREDAKLTETSSREADSKMLLALLFATGSLFVPLIPIFPMVYMLRAGAKGRQPLSLKSKIAFWLAIIIAGLSHLALAAWVFGGLNF
jgi:hypothetical protein